MWVQPPARQHIAGEQRQIWLLQHSSRRRSQAGTEGVCRLANVPTIMDRLGFSWWFGYRKSRKPATVDKGKILADNANENAGQGGARTRPRFPYLVNKSDGPAALDRQSRAAVVAV
jgi:hypothetical protein